MKLKWGLCLGAVALFGAAAPAQAQVVIDAISQAVANSVGNRNGGADACLEGRESSPRRTAGVLRESEAAMQAYLRVAQAEGPVDVRATYTIPLDRARWTLAGQNSPLDAIRDPLARMVATGAARFGPPSAFVRGGNGRAAIGVWPVMATDGATRLGHYRTLFVRGRGGWKLFHLDLVEGAAEAEAVTHFCEVPGDVEQYRAEAERMRDDPKNGAGEQTVVE